MTLRHRFKQWLDRSDGGQWYEPYVTNGDIIYIGIITLIVSGTIIVGCWML